MSKTAWQQTAGPATTDKAERHTRIIATLGPLNGRYKSTEEMVGAFYDQGADFFRLNFSHGSHADYQERIEAIRAVERQRGVQIGIIADLQGPKLRIGDFADDKIALERGQEIRFDLDPAPGDGTRINFPHPEIIAALEEGAQIFMDDGHVGLKVTEKGDGFFIATVRYGQALSNRKGVNVPHLTMPVDPLTQKDLEDLDFALAQQVDWIALSFVQSAADVQAAKAIIGDRAGLIAKIEKPAAARKNFDEILAAADAIMLARGDLSIEIPLEQVPSVRKIITYKCRLADKPCIIATQMLETMIHKRRPTSAEASDVAQAVWDGASAVMLSAESAVGDYPEEAIHMMDQICTEQEHGPTHSLAMRAFREAPEDLGIRPHLHPAPRREPAAAASPVTQV